MAQKATAEISVKYRPQAASGFSIFGGTQTGWAAQNLKLRPSMYENTNFSMIQFFMPILCQLADKAICKLFEQINKS